METAVDVAETLDARVRAQYEALPYPAYPLFLPLRPQEAYASNSLFAARVAEQHDLEPVLRRRPDPAVLMAGCGEVFPYLATAWEPRRHRLVALDISSRSLRRARLRCLPRLRAVEWRRGDLADAGVSLPAGLAHLDCYGVLHHLSRPAAALARLSTALAPGGTARIMVYNSAARGWIRHLQRAFALLGLSGLRAEDRAAARSLLDAAAAASPALRDRLAPMGATLGNPARLVDTFLHAREARLDWLYWRRAIAAAGLRVLGLYDRYGELDDLPNPLLQPPGDEALRSRVADRRFENNFELFLAKPLPSGGAIPAEGSDAAGILAAAAAHGPRGLALRSPPVAWTGYRETRALPLSARQAVWRHFLANLGGARRCVDGLAARLPPRAFQRLGRLGAVFPDECASAELRELLRAPLETGMEPPEYAPAADLRGDRVLRDRISALLGPSRRRARRLEAVVDRLEAAQRP